MSSLSAWFVMYFVFPLCIFKPTFRLSEFKLFRCFSICFVVSLKRATSSANLKLVRFSPSTLTPSELSALLSTSSMTAVNNLGESGSPCLTPLCIGNSVDTSLSRWTLAVAWCGKNGDVEADEDAFISLSHHLNFGDGFHDFIP